ncbi:MAG TPA: hypothetical protein PLP29_13115 [Candidatus Ozemobacteraceae bacterium]|nr:hypothetical protein [Candidatus Ozemobacteraceae bacterium]
MTDLLVSRFISRYSDIEINPNFAFVKIFFSISPEMRFFSLAERRDEGEPAAGNFLQDPPTDILHPEVTPPGFTPKTSQQKAFAGWPFFPRGPLFLPGNRRKSPRILRNHSVNPHSSDEPDASTAKTISHACFSIF